MHIPTKRALSTSEQMQSRDAVGEHVVRVISRELRNGDSHRAERYAKGLLNSTLASEGDAYWLAMRAGRAIFSAAERSNASKHLLGVAEAVFEEVRWMKPTPAAHACLAVCAVRRGDYAKAARRLPEAAQALQGPSGAQFKRHIEGQRWWFFRPPPLPDTVEILDLHPVAALPTPFTLRLPSKA